MRLLTSQERNVIGLFRHNWLKNPEILLSPENLPSHISKNEEEKNITNHNLAIKDQLQKSDIEETNVISKVSEPNGNISSKLSVELQPNNAVN